MKPNKSYRETVVLENVTHTFANSISAMVVLRNVSLTGRVGELTLLLGRSGSGKTTLLSLAAGLLEPTSGRIRIFNRDLSAYRKAELQRFRASSMGFVFQTFRLIESITAAQNVAMVLEFAGRSRREARHRARDLLSQMGIGHLADRKPGRFSQGEKQRVAIARAMANRPSLILADEPTACLESKQGLEVIRRLHEYALEGHGSVLVASHDMRLNEYADRICCIQDGVLTEIAHHNPDTKQTSIVKTTGDKSIGIDPVTGMRCSS